MCIFFLHRESEHPITLACPHGDHDVNVDNNHENKHPHGWHGEMTSFFVSIMVTAIFEHVL